MRCSAKEWVSKFEDYEIIVSDDRSKERDPGAEQHGGQLAHEPAEGAVHAPAAHRARTEGSRVGRRAAAEQGAPQHPQLSGESAVTQPESCALVGLVHQLTEGRGVNRLNNSVSEN